MWAYIQTYIMDSILSKLLWIHEYIMALLVAAVMSHNLNLHILLAASHGVAQWDRMGWAQCLCRLVFGYIQIKWQCMRPIRHRESCQGIWATTNSIITSQAFPPPTLEPSLPILSLGTPQSVHGITSSQLPIKTVDCLGGSINVDHV